MKTNDPLTTDTPIRRCDHCGADVPAHLVHIPAGPRQTDSNGVHHPCKWSVIGREPKEDRT